MNCESINGLQFDAESKRAIEKIRSRAELTKFMSGTLSLGVLSNIFSTNAPLQVSYNIYSTDFVAFSKATMGLERIYRYKVRQIAEQQYLRVGDYNQRRFWRMILEGCKIDE